MPPERKWKMDEKCIFSEVKRKCLNVHCEECRYFKKHEVPVQLVNIHRLWFAYLLANNELPEGLRERHLYAKRAAVRSKAQIEKDMAGEVHKRAKNRLSRSEARKLAWRMGKYNGVDHRRKS